MILFVFVVPRARVFPRDSFSFLILLAFRDPACSCIILETLFVRVFLRGLFSRDPVSFRDPVC